MALEPAIDVQRLGKRYHLGMTGDGTLVTRLGSLFSRHGQPREQQEFWALRGVDLSIQQGEVFGLIGRNGAGKSTLLKLLSRITRPTEGRIEMRGRVGSLLEVGTGFHPELTGRENVYLNGAILGMRRAEILSVFDEIVAFSGIEEFIDTPAKRYSSGMYVRLAFAVAAHFEPEILLVDEVLAVGDAEFQRRCLGKLREVAGGGRTVVLVSHNMAAIRRLCGRACWIDGGHVREIGASSDVVDAYLRATESVVAEGTARLDDLPDRISTGQALLRSASLLDPESGEPTATLHLDDPVRVRATVEVFEELYEAAVEIGICTHDGERFATAQNIDFDRPPARFPIGTYTVHADLHASLLPGEFTLDVGIHQLTGHTADYVTRALRFTVVNSSRRSDDHWPWGPTRGSLRPPSSWSFDRTSPEAFSAGKAAVQGETSDPNA